MHTILPYLYSCLFIAGWWGLAFWGTSSPQTALTSLTLAPVHAPLSLFEGLSSLDREAMHRALLGDYALMGRLIAEWDLDSQIMLQRGSPGIKRLSQNAFLGSQILTRKLTSPSSTSKTHRRFFPQTYVSASFLLAFLNPKQIVALPSGLREHPHLFPETITQAIPYDSDHTHSERLFLARPEVAFVAPYSNPAFVDALRNQGIPICLIPSSNDPEEIIALTRAIGQTVGESEKAELLALFMEAALYSLDNRVSTLCHTCWQDSPPRFLVIKAQAGYALPTLKTLTGQLLARMKLNVTQNTTSWNLPISRETILQQDPHALIISTIDKEASQDDLKRDPALSSLRAIQTGNLFFIDETVQQCASQHLVLAYYDLFEALLASHREKPL